MPTVLYLAHGFPPAGGSGAVRSLAFARYLPMYGWRPLVVTPGPRWATNADARLGAQVPAWLEVIRTPSLEPEKAPEPPGPAATPATTQRVAGERHIHRHTERHTPAHTRHTVEKRSQVASGHPLRRHTNPLGCFLRSLKGQLGHARRFPDAHLGWLPFALWAGLRLAPRVDVLYSSSGPFTSHLVGLVLHVLTGRAWVAELRDGWYRWNRAIFPDYPAWRGPLEAWLEGQVLRRATRVVCVTERMADAFRCQYPDLPAEHFTVVPNGFDPGAQVGIDAGEDHGPADVLNLLHADHGRPDELKLVQASDFRAEGFTVLHAGALYYGRSIRPFLEAAARLASEDAEFARAFRLDLFGSLDQTARAEVDGSAVAANVVCHGQLDHPSTLARERAADLLLLVANTTPGAQATVPGKVFEYLASARPVLAIAPRESATADVLARTGGGWLADAADPEAVYRQLRAAFRGHASQVDQHELARFDRRRLAGELARVLDAALFA